MQPQLARCLRVAGIGIGDKSEVEQRIRRAPEPLQRPRAIQPALEIVRVFVHGTGQQLCDRLGVVPGPHIAAFHPEPGEQRLVLQVARCQRAGLRYQGERILGAPTPQADAGRLQQWVVLRAALGRRRGTGSLPAIELTGAGVVPMAWSRQIDAISVAVVGGGELVTVERNLLSVHRPPWVDASSLVSVCSELAL